MSTPSKRVRTTAEPGVLKELLAGLTAAISAPGQAVDALVRLHRKPPAVDEETGVPLTDIW